MCRRFSPEDSSLDLVFTSAASRKLGTLLTKVAASKHFQRFAALKPVASVIEKLSNAEVGAKVELTSFSGLMTVNTMRSLR